MVTSFPKFRTIPEISYQNLHFSCILANCYYNTKEFGRHQIEHWTVFHEIKLFASKFKLILQQRAKTILYFTTFPRTFNRIQLINWIKTWIIEFLSLFLKFYANFNLTVSKILSLLPSIFQFDLQKTASQISSQKHHYSVTILQIALQQQTNIRSSLYQV